MGSHIQLHLGVGSLACWLAVWLTVVCSTVSAELVNIEVKDIFDDVSAACEPEVRVGGRPRSLVANKS